MCLLFSSFYERDSCYEPKSSFQCAFRDSDTGFCESREITELHSNFKWGSSSHRRQKGGKCFKVSGLAIRYHLGSKWIIKADKVVDHEDQAVVQFFNSESPSPKPYFSVSKFGTSTCRALLQSSDISPTSAQDYLFSISLQEQAGVLWNLPTWFRPKSGRG